MNTERVALLQDWRGHFLLNYSAGFFFFKEKRRWLCGSDIKYSQAYMTVNKTYTACWTTEIISQIESLVLKGCAVWCDLPTYRLPARTTGAHKFDIVDYATVRLNAGDWVIRIGARSSSSWTWTVRKTEREKERARARLVRSRLLIAAITDCNREQELVAWTFYHTLFKCVMFHIWQKSNHCNC